MKRYIMILMLSLIAGSLYAQQIKESYSRSITKYGGSFTIGDTFAMDNLGYGLTTMIYQFIEPTQPWGFYYGLGGADIVHTVGGVTIGDMRPVTIGWRKEVVGPFGFDVSISPVLGSRIIGNTIYGNFYLGIKPMIGTFFVLTEGIDIEFAYEPVINVYNFSGAEVGNKTYHDFSVYVLLKNFSLIRSLGWNSSSS